MHRGWQCAAPNQLPDVGPGGAPKGASPGLGRGLNAIFCLVSGASCVGKCVEGVKQVWQCSVLLAVCRRCELRLLKLRELIFFVDTLADFNAAEQRQLGQQGRVKWPNVHSSAKQNVSLQVVFPHYVAPYAGPGDKPSLGGGAWIVSLQLLFSHFAGPQAGWGEQPGLGRGAWTVCLQVVCLQCIAIFRAGRIAWPWLGNLIVHFHHVCPMHCHKLDRAFCLVLAEAKISFT